MIELICKTFCQGGVNKMFKDRLLEAMKKFINLINLKDDFEFKYEVHESKFLNLYYVAITYKKQLLIILDDDGRISFYRMHTDKDIGKTIENDYWLITSFLLDSEEKLKIVKQVINYLVSEIENHRELDVSRNRSIIYHTITTRHCLDNYFNQPLQRIKIKEYDGVELLSIKRQAFPLFSQLGFTNEKLKTKYDNILHHICFTEDEKISLRINGLKELTISYKGIQGLVELCTIYYNDELQEKICDMIRILKNSVFGNANLMKNYVKGYLKENNINEVEYLQKDISLLDTSHKLIKRKEKILNHKDFFKKINITDILDISANIYLFDRQYFEAKKDSVNIRYYEDDILILDCQKENSLIVKILVEKTEQEEIIEKAIEYLNSVSNFSSNTIDDLKTILMGLDIEITTK